MAWSLDTSWLDSYSHRAMLEAALVGAVCGAVGVHVVLRRLGFFAMAMTHATFPGVVLAAVPGIDIYLGGVVMGLLVCICVLVLAPRHERGATTATAVVLAVGVALVSASNGFDHDWEAFLTGSMLTVDEHDLAVTASTGSLVLLTLVALYKELLHGAFDPAGQRAAGYPAAALDLVLLVLVEAAIIVTAPPSESCSPWPSSSDLPPPHVCGLTASEPPCCSPAHSAPAPVCSASPFPATSTWPSAVPPHW